MHEQSSHWINFPLSLLPILPFSSCSASHVVILLVKKYPNYRIVNFDKLDYCSSLKNLDSIADAPNYSFVKVCDGQEGVLWPKGDVCMVSVV